MVALHLVRSSPLGPARDRIAVQIHACIITAVQSRGWREATGDTSASVPALHPSGGSRVASRSSFWSLKRDTCRHHHSFKTHTHTHTHHTPHKSEYPLRTLRVRTQETHRLAKGVTVDPEAAMSLLLLPPQTSSPARKRNAGGFHMSSDDCTLFDPPHDASTHPYDREIER